MGGPRIITIISTPRGGWDDLLMSGPRPKPDAADELVTWEQTTSHMTQKNLENWSVSASPYDAPELKIIRLVGRLSCGKEIVTSPVVGATGRLVRTRSGSLYRLGDVDPDYLKWLQETNRKFDPENPITALDPA